MTDKIVVLVTAASLKEARKIAQALVKARLAACVNVVPAVESIYRWQGKIESSRERLLVIKTAREVLHEVEGQIRKLHSYTNPEIICLPIVDGSREYLDWLARSVKTVAGADSER
jgi:periplasmic divalent cation tolerance protein